MNILTTLGNLVADPEEAQTNGGPVTRIRVADDDYSRDVMYWKLSAFEERHRRLLSKAKKGSSVLVTAELKPYKDDEGKGRQPSGVIQSIKFASSGGKGKQQQQQQQQDDNLPF